MPSKGCRRLCGGTYAKREALRLAKQKASWERQKAAVAAKYAQETR